MNINEVMSVDLSNLDLSGIDLSGIDFGELLKSDMVQEVLSGAKGDGADFGSGGKDEHRRSHHSGCECEKCAAKCKQKCDEKCDKKCAPGDDIGALLNSLGGGCDGGLGLDFIISLLPKTPECVLLESLKPFVSPEKCKKIVEAVKILVIVGIVQKLGLLKGGCVR